MSIFFFLVSKYFLLQSLNSFCQWPFVHSSYNLSVNAQLSKAKCNIAMVEYQRLTAIAKKKYYFNLTVAFNWQIHCVLNWMLQTNKFP